MKNYSVIFCLLLATISISCKQKTTANIGEAAAYICPMHPAEVSITPGICAICKMALIPMENPTDSAYTCPMHPEEKSNSVAKCSVCNMDMEPVKKSDK